MKSYLWLSHYKKNVLDLIRVNFFFYFFVFCFVFSLPLAGFEVAFVHPKSAAGVLVELVQAPADVIKALS